MKVTEVKIRVRYKETDQMGVVHHSNYYPWFEVARTEFMRKCGHELQADGGEWSNASIAGNPLLVISREPNMMTLLPFAPGCPGLQVSG
jgi:hypothetical protein